MASDQRVAVSSPVDDESCPDQHECPRRFEIEKSFRMAKSDLQARPIYHRTRDSIEAHLTIVFAALAVSRWIENTSGWSIRKFVKTARRCHTIEVQAGTTPSPPPTPSPANSAKPSKRSTAPAGLRTSLAEVR